MHHDPSHLARRGGYDQAELECSNDSMISRPIGWLAAITLLAIGVVSGVLIERWLAASNATQVASTARDSTNGDVTASLAELRLAIDKLPSSVRDQVRDELAGATARQPIDGAASDIARLAQAVEQLNQLLAKPEFKSETKRALGRGAPESWKGPGYPAIDTMCKRFDELRLGAIGDWRQASEEEFTNAHMLWTRDDVIARYGPPHRANTTAGIGLVYDQYAFQEPDATCWIEFTTQEGVVTDVLTMCKDIH